MSVFSRLPVLLAIISQAISINVVPAPGTILDSPLKPLQQVVNLRASAAVASAASAAVASTRFTHALRLCNAYASPTNFSVFLETEQLTAEAMSYKECREFSPALKAGDTLFFKAGGADVGSFAISELPGRDAKLLLVIHRKDAISASPAIKSHIFENVENPQVAVMDAYQGKAQSVPFIMDAVKSDEAGGEQLSYDAVVAVNPGQFVVALKSKGKPVAVAALAAEANESYVVLRIGVDAMLGTSYPEELIIFPQPAGAQSGASAVFSSLALFIALAAAW